VKGFIMSKFSKVLFAAVAASVGITAAAQAATVTYSLSLNDNGAGVATPGSWALYADVSQGDNAGLVGYGAQLANNTTAASRTPFGQYQYGGANDPPPPDFIAGFSNSRVATVGAALSGAQDTTVSTAWVLAGFGQSSFTMASKIPAVDYSYVNLGGATATSSPKAHLLLNSGLYGGTTATGSGPNTGDGFAMLPTDYVSFPSAVKFDTTQAGINNTKANVLVAGSVNGPGTSESTIGAVIVTRTVNLIQGGGQVTTPEPASLGVLALGGLAMLARRRKA